MSKPRKHRAEDRAARLAEAEGAEDTLNAQDSKISRQLGLVEKLTAGWRKVHETNHLAQLFREEGHLG